MPKIEISQHQSVSKNGIHSENWLTREIDWNRVHPLKYWWWWVATTTACLFSHGITTDIYHFVCDWLNRVLLNNTIQYWFCVLTRQACECVCMCVCYSRKKIRVWKTTAMRERTRERNLIMSKKPTHSLNVRFWDAIFPSHNEIGSKRMSLFMFLHHAPYVCTTHYQFMMNDDVVRVCVQFICRFQTHSPAHEYHHTRSLVY